jgi:hypothetical protein
MQSKINAKKNSTLNTSPPKKSNEITYSTMNKLLLQSMKVMIEAEEAVDIMEKTISNSPGGSGANKSP